MKISKKLQIVVIEDNQDLREMLVEDILSANFFARGYSSVEAYKAEGAEVDVFLLDINLPGQSGLDFARDIRQRDQVVGIVILTAKSGAINRASGYQSGVDLYLQKPCSSMELIAALDRVAERIVLHKKTNAQHLNFTSLAVERMVLMGQYGETVLTPREVNFLVKLCTSVDRQLDYASCEEIFNLKSNCDSAALGVAVGRLRKKIGTVTEDGDSIISVRGFGYKLVMELSIN